ncbi:FAD/NAD(P)-binding domain-containing protein [Aspergillus sclerotiicarbonarius CBS 121057]|uniref:FAD/NAD(P)-binding domain-containing protein n=1 Tax=Aspergillus sclerotiicarbonarius (strain CBS 121057 / IBT 28362) TaxID=1448318 RepID=A0A319EK46_ASPSB|nr:FAD/NAD(P)-binding domain-containing protein [Aspergillus sclerotiicarbonarius CBS 121057]
MFLTSKRLPFSWIWFLICSVTIALVISSIGPRTLEDRNAQSNNMAASSLKNVIVVGGSYVGKGAAQEIARVLPSTHRVLLIEPHSHFHHLFAFPRFAVLSGHEQKAFIPYTRLFSSVPNSTQHAVVQARVLSVQPEHVNLDRDWQGQKQIPYEYLVVATGTRLAEPAAMKDEDKPSSVLYLQKHQADVKKAKSVVIVGGGAVGVQMATDMKELYPEKEITVVQSRDKLMPQFHHGLHELVKKRFEELGINLITGTRIVVPQDGFPNNGTPFNVQLNNGTSLTTEFVILATGQKPNNDLIKDLPSSSSDSLINPDNGFIRIRPTLQFQDAKYPNLFALGDIADTGLRKAARPGGGQAAAVAKNIQAMIEGRKPEDVFPPFPMAIHITLGLKYNIVFRNPNPAEGQNEPVIKESWDSQEDMGIDRWWERMGFQENGPSQYHL